MLHEIAKELDAALEAKGVPLHVVSGPELTQSTSLSRERIVLEHDLDGGDTFGPIKGINHHASTVPAGAKQRLVRMVGATLRIWAQDTAAGARVHEHRLRAEKVLSGVLHTLIDVLRRRRAEPFEIRSGQFLSADDLEMRGIQQWSGAVYELRFAFARAIEDRKWDGTTRPAAALEGVSNANYAQVSGGARERISAE